MYEVCSCWKWFKPMRCHICVETKEAHSLYQYARSIDLNDLSVAESAFDGGYQNVNRECSLSTLYSAKNSGIVL